MGYVKVNVKVRSIQHPKKETEIQLLADADAIYTIISSDQLKELGVKPTGKRSFKTADPVTGELKPLELLLLTTMPLGLHF